MKVVEAIKNRRSIRSFRDQKVSKETMISIIETSKYAPTWNHFQIVRYNVIEDKDMIGKIAQEALLDFRHNMGIVEGAAGIMIMSHVAGKSGRFPGIQKSAEEWEMFDAGCAAQSFSLAAYAHGVGSVILGAFDQEKLAKIINLPENEVVSTIIPFGYEVEHPATPPRKSITEVARFL